MSFKTRVFIFLTSGIVITVPIPLPIDGKFKDLFTTLDAVLGLEDNVDNADTKLEYKPSLEFGVDSYGDQEPSCHTEQKVLFEDKCETYTETTCYTQNKEKCEEDWLKNCTGIIQTKVDRRCFNVIELLCSLKEDILYQTLRETYQIQRCFVAKDRVCDTIFAMDTDSQDDVSVSGAGDSKLLHGGCGYQRRHLHSVDFTCKNMMPHAYERAFLHNKGKTY